MNEVGVVEPDNKNEISIKQEIDHDDLNSIETLSASECEDEEDALPERETYEVINTDSSGGKFSDVVYNRRPDIARITVRSIREATSTDLFF